MCVGVGLIRNNREEGLSEKARWHREGVQMESWAARRERSRWENERPHKIILPTVLPLS